ncbi:hypothetical protein SRB5_58370 [Streptomyces sp. RB5]|uniref:DUF397 domain-containing protein n=1 Tax=Streptomyces smaragdinus TaxID=2585196 RepID=A0A7K0CQB1_9ACTN|nr:DUF397 domain-containing protein [Streptomyces smaragdinus]MQY15649.1 hypothetical protein [Streptomyces smaragdinus]
MADQAAVWKKSSFSQASGECIEISATSDGILIRESDDPETIVTTDKAKLRAFLLGVKAGEFDHLT